MRRNLAWAVSIVAAAAVLLAWAVEHRRRAARSYEGEGTARPVPEKGTERRNETEPSVIVSVLHRTDLKPIEGASVEFSDPKPGLVRTDAAGEARIPTPGRNRLRVSAEGFIGLAQTFDFAPGRHALLLDRAGSLELRFVDADGKPVSDVRLRMIEPGLPFVTARPVAQAVASDAEGVAVWRELPAGRCAWRCESEHVIAEAGKALLRGPKLLENDGLVTVLDDDLKASFRQEQSVEIEAGQRTRLTYTVAKPGVVHGFLVDRRGAPLEGAVVKLMHRFELEKPKYRSIDFEASATTKRDGSFVIRRAMPGSKRVKGFAVPSKGRFLFYSVELELGLGEERDLGVLSPLEGHAIEGMVRLSRDLGGVVLTKRRALVQMTAATREFVDGTGPGTVATEVIEVDVDEPFHLEGLPAGRVTLHASPRIEWQPPAGSERAFSVQFESSEQRDYDVPRDSKAELVLPVIVKAEVRVTLRPPSEGLAAGDRVAIFLVPKGPGTLTKLTQARLDSDAQEHAGWATAGDYEVWACTTGVGARGNWFGRAGVTVMPGQANRCEVLIGRGAVLTGRAVDATGKPWQGAIVFALDQPGLTAASRGPGLHVATPDQDGRFTVGGVAPGATLIWAGHQKVTAGAEGTETVVELRGR